MKWLKVFSVFIVLHVLLWAGAHTYRTLNPTVVLVGVDTSFSLKPQFPAMQAWIEAYEAEARYESISVVTDKSAIGPLSDISSRQSIFRTAFGRSSAADFETYNAIDADRKVLLSDGSFDLNGWDTVTFN
jgi:hypothetical protein